MKPLALACTLALIGCVSTQEIPLQQNAVRVQAQGRGLIGVEAAPKTVLRRAAKLTLDRGYERFILVDAGANQGRAFAGLTPTYSRTNASVSPGARYATAQTTTYGGVPVYVPTSSVGATVVMLNPGDDGFATAIDAARVLAAP